MRIPSLLLSLLLYVGIAAAQESLTTAFSYQGELVLSGTPITGAADMRLSLYDAESSGSAVGAAVNFDGISNPPVDLADGVFTVKLDFGAAALNGDRRWLNIQVRYPAGSGSYVTMSPRQELTGAPYALQTRGLFVDGQNRVGIGTTTPAWQLDMLDAQSVIRMTSTISGNGSVIELKNSGINPSSLGAINFNDAASTYPGQISYENQGEHSLNFRVEGSAPISVTKNRLNFYGQSAVLYASGSGTSEAAIQAYQFQTNAGMAGYFVNNSNFATAHFQNNGTGEVLWLQQGGSGSNYIVATNGSDWKFWVDNAGVTHTKALQILGGSDLSEKFDVIDPEFAMEAGMTVSIDPNHEGKLQVSRTAYDFRVAGIVSGAGGVNPGMVMGQAGSVADGEHAIALTGRVYCLVDAEYGAIEPGDLLTTSDTPGYAMRVDDSARASGATIGKAMGRLDGGRGLVLVLVGLQ
jgi:hypothetical protein